MKREAEQTWAAERVENALLRERINDIAAQIARMTVALDGTNSPIEAMLASDAVNSNAGRATASTSPRRRPASRGQPCRSHSRAAVEGFADPGDKPEFLILGIA